MKAPFVIYADFESVIKNIPENECEKTECTEKTKKHEACGFAFTVVRSDGKVMTNNTVVKYRQETDSQEHTAKEFIKKILEVEKLLRKSLETPEKKR